MRWTVIWLQGWFSFSFASTEQRGAPPLLLHQDFIPTKNLLKTRGSIFTPGHNLAPALEILAPKMGPTYNYIAHSTNRESCLCSRWLHTRHPSPVLFSELNWKTCIVFCWCAKDRGREGEFDMDSCITLTVSPADWWPICLNLDTQCASERGKPVTEWLVRGLVMQPDRSEHSQWAVCLLHKEKFFQ